METALGSASWLLDQVLNKLSNDLVAGYEASHDLGFNFQTIQRHLKYTQGLLHEAQQRELTNNLGLQGLLEDLSKKGDEADDALDELHYFMIQDNLDGTRDAAPDLDDGVRSQALHARHAVRHNVGNWLSCFTCFHSQDDVVAATENTYKSKPHNDDIDGHADKLLQFDRVAMSNKIKQLIVDIHSLCEPINNLLQINLSSNPQQVRRPITSSRSTPNEFYGRDDIFKNTIGDLTGSTYYKTLSVLPIVGPGGVGKTTFTQHLFNDERIKESFPVRIWLSVSNNFDVLKLTQEIYSYILAAENEDSNRANSTISNLSLLHENIEKRLKSKRFLIVFDDIWECKNKSDWDNLLAPLKKGEPKGNMVLVTTRFPKIANMVKNEEISPINLQGLEPHGFWEFFQVCAFGEVTDEQDKHGLIDIAKAISDKLKCSPLAAKTVGPLLRKNLSREHWIGILNKKEWENLKHSDDNIMPALKISYDYLPFHLKQCFSYCGLFPEDHLFIMKMFARFWDAIGIMHTSGQTQSVEDLVEGLVDNGFLIKLVIDSTQYYVLHDLMHELSQKVSSQECINISFTGFVAECIPPSVRHVSIIIPSPRKCSKDIEQEMNKLKTRIDIGNLRTLMIFRGTFAKIENRHAKILKDTFNKIKDLRVLLIDMPSPESLPCNFSKLIHLRYLGIRTFSSVSLPSAISRFYHLKFFVLEESGDSSNAPKDFNRLVNLRHVLASNEFHSSIPRVGKMECLEVLDEFRVKKESDGFELAELGKLTKLNGSLRILGLEKVKTKEEGEEALLKNKSNLSELLLKFSRTGQTTGHDAIEGLRPHPSLKGLEIKGHSGITGPSWLCRDICVTSLESLSLSGISWDVLPPLGRLPLLRSLRLSEIHGLCQFRLDCGGVSDESFKHLKEIRFQTMPDLVGWIGGDNSHLFSKLESIGFNDCPNLMTLPFSQCNDISTEGRDIKWFPNLRGFVIENCPKLLPHLPPIPHTSTLTDVDVSGEAKCKIYEKSLIVSRYSGALVFDNLGSKIEYMGIEDAPHILLTDLQKLSLLRVLDVSGDMFSGEVGAGVILPLVQKAILRRFHPTGMLLSNVFKCLPALTEMELIDSTKDHGELVLQFPPSKLLCSIEMVSCHNLILSAEGGGAFRDLTSLQSLGIYDCGKIFWQWSLAEASQVINTFPASIRELYLEEVPDKMSMAVLSNLTSLTCLGIWSGHNLTIHGFNPLIGLGLKKLLIVECGSVAADLSAEVAKNEALPAGSWQLESLAVDNISAVLMDPICWRLSATLRELGFWSDKMMERFTQEQEKALQLLTALETLGFYGCTSLQSLPTCDFPTSLEHLEFNGCRSLQSLPEAIHRLCSLKKLVIWECPKIQCLPTSGLPTSLEALQVSGCSDDLRIELQRLEETHPYVVIYFD